MVENSVGKYLISFFNKCFSHLSRVNVNEELEISSSNDRYRIMENNNNVRYLILFTFLLNE